MRDQILQRLIDQAEATAIRVEKCRIYCILLSTPQLISSIILSISILQVLPSYDKIPPDYLKEILSAILIIFSLIGLILDMKSKKKAEYKASQKVYLEYMRIFNGIYKNLQNSNEEQLKNSSETIDRAEEYYDEDENPYFLLGNNFALKQFLKKKKAFYWIVRNYENKKKIKST